MGRQHLRDKGLALHVRAPATPLPPPPRRRGLGPTFLARDETRHRRKKRATRGSFWGSPADCLGVGYPGQGSVANAEQRAEVVRLRREGVSIRGIELWQRSANLPHDHT